MTTNERLIAAAKDGNSADIQQIIELSLSTTNYGAALEEAAQYNRLECAEILIPLATQKAHDNALRAASVAEHMDFCDLIFAHTSAAGRNAALVACARCNVNTSVLSYFIANGVKDTHGKALIEAAGRGNEEWVNLLIPVSKPKAQNSQALLFAAYHGYENCAKSLFDVSNPKKVWNYLNTNFPNNPTWKDILDKLFAQQQKTKITVSIANTQQGPTPSRKM